MAHVIVANPKRGKKRRATRKNPAPAHGRRRSGRRRTRRNPIGGMLRTRGSGGLFGGISRAAMSAGLGAAGAIGVDFLLRFAPVSMKVGPMSHVTKAAVAIGVGLIGRKNALVAGAAQGALTVALYGAARQFLAVPMGLSEISEADMYELANTYGDDGMGSYTMEPGVTSPALGVNSPALGAYEFQDADYVNS